MNRQPASSGLVFFHEKKESAKPKIHLGKTHSKKIFFFIYVYSYTTVVPKHYREIYIFIYMCIFEAPPMRQSPAHIIGPVKEQYHSV